MHWDQFCHPYTKSLYEAYLIKQAFLWKKQHKHFFDNCKHRNWFITKISSISWQYLLWEYTKSQQIEQSSVIKFLVVKKCKPCELNRKMCHTSLNKSWAWHIDGTSNKKKIHDFYKVLTFKWHVSKFEPNRIISLQITVIYVKLLLQIFKTVKKSEFCMLIKHCFLIGKKYCSSNGLISVIWTLLRWNQWLRGGKLTLNMVIWTQMLLNAQVTQIQQLSRKTPKTP